MTKLPLPPLPGHAPSSTPATTSTLPVPDDTAPAEVVGVRPLSEVPDVHTVGLAPAMLPRVPSVDAGQRNGVGFILTGTVTGRFSSAGTSNLPKPEGITTTYISAGYEAPTIDMLDTPLPSAEALAALVPPTPKRRRVGTLDPASGYKRAPWTPEQDLSVRLRAVTAESVEDFLEHFPTRSPEALAHRLNLAARDVENFIDDAGPDPMPEYVARRSLWITDCLGATDAERVAEYSLRDLRRDTVRVFREMATAVRTYAATGETGNIAATTDPHSRHADLRAAFILAMPRPGDPVGPPEGVWFDPGVVPQRGPSGADFLRRVVDSIRDRSARGCVEVYNRRPPPTSAPPAEPVVAQTVAPAPDLRGTPVLDTAGLVIGMVTGRDDKGIHTMLPEGVTRFNGAQDVGVLHFMARSNARKAIDAWWAAVDAQRYVDTLRNAILAPATDAPGSVIAVVGALGQSGRMDPRAALDIVLAEVAKLRGIAADTALGDTEARANAAMRAAGTVAFALEAIPDPFPGGDTPRSDAFAEGVSRAINAADHAAVRRPRG